MPVGGDAQHQHVGVVAALVHLGLHDLDALLPGDAAGVDDVGVLAHDVGQHADDGGDGHHRVSRLAISPWHSTSIFLTGPSDSCTQNAPKPLGQPDERRHLGVHPADRHVHGVGDLVVHQEHLDVLGHLHGDLLLGLLGRSAQVGREHQVVQGQQLGALGRLLLEHVQGGAGDGLRLQRLVQGRPRR